MLMTSVKSYKCMVSYDETRDSNHCAGFSSRHTSPPIMKPGAVVTVPGFPSV
jgi:hypothetical protein